jgi:hypothetical protein
MLQLLIVSIAAAVAAIITQRLKQAAYLKERDAFRRKLEESHTAFTAAVEAIDTAK